jgi:hypothetical protein
MANVNTINSLESIEKKTIYSKYGENLNRIFKSRSLKSLIYELKNPKKFTSKEMLEAPEFQKKKPKEHKEENYSDIFNSVQSYLKREAKKENQKARKPNKVKIKVNEGRSILDLHEFKDPFKYNPNYNAISKNVPSVKMILTEREKKEMVKEQEEKKRNRILKLVHSNTESGDKKNKLLLQIEIENSNPNIQIYENQVNNNKCDNNYNVFEKKVEKNKNSKSKKKKLKYFHKKNKSSITNYYFTENNSTNTILNCNHNNIKNNKYVIHYKKNISSLIGGQNRINYKDRD